MFKNHLRQQHQIPCLPEDVFQPLRDAFEGWSICRHCKHHFVTLYALRDRINKRACHAFVAIQVTMQPIVAREELRMHVRHRSFMELMLDRALCSELATRCTLQFGNACRSHDPSLHGLTPVGRPCKTAVRLCGRTVQSSVRQRTVPHVSMQKSWCP